MLYAATSLRRRTLAVVELAREVAVGACEDGARVGVAARRRHESAVGRARKVEALVHAPRAAPAAAPAAVVAVGQPVARPAVGGEPVAAPPQPRAPLRSVGRVAVGRARGAPAAAW
eukprot:scaffold65408_cov61-Phaeocystis_antarctica.AAC.3